MQFDFVVNWKEMYKSVCTCVHGIWYVCVHHLFVLYLCVNRTVLAHFLSKYMKARPWKAAVTMPLLQPACTLLVGRRVFHVLLRVSLTYCLCLVGNDCTACTLHVHERIFSARELVTLILNFVFVLQKFVQYPGLPRKRLDEFLNLFLRIWKLT